MVDVGKQFELSRKNLLDLTLKNRGLQITQILSTTSAIP